MIPNMSRRGGMVKRSRLKGKGGEGKVGRQGEAQSHTGKEGKERDSGIHINNRMLLFTSTWESFKYIANLVDQICNKLGGML